MTKPITSFRGPYYFLSNFALLVNPIKWEGYECPTSEHAYQIAKIISNEGKQRIAENKSPKNAKYCGRIYPPIKNWDSVKVRIMRDIVFRKFSANPTFLTALHETGDAILMEGNWWGDLFWGVDRNSLEGENHLGKILMEVRKEL